MYRCALCRRPVPLDDVDIAGSAGYCICLTCWLRMAPPKNR